MVSSELFGEFITLSIMAFALGMDAFSVSLGMGMIPLRLKRIAMIGIVIGIFHMIMPLAGVILGDLLSHQFGAYAKGVGGLLLLLLGIQMFWGTLREEEENVVNPHGMGLIVFALSVSLDSFSVGLSLGMFGAKIVLALILFGGASMALTWAGLLLGRHVRSWLGVYSEILGASILLGLGLRLLF
ncbi:manganese efflux pump [Bacillaceae bacterium S4-13-56]